MRTFDVLRISATSMETIRPTFPAGLRRWNELFDQQNIQTRRALKAERGRYQKNDIGPGPLNLAVAFGNIERNGGGGRSSWEWTASVLGMESRMPFAQATKRMASW
jgi:hypothetical protein